MRHGLSVMNKQGVFSGLNDTPLAEEGLDQCRQAAIALKPLKIDVIVSSPMKRALDSARIIARGIGYPEDQIIVSELFVERSFGPLEGAKYTKTHNLDNTDGVEHSSALIDRAKAGLSFVESLEANNVLLVSHGAIGRAIKKVLNPHLDYHEVEGFNNAEIVKLI